MRIKLLEQDEDWDAGDEVDATIKVLFTAPKGGHIAMYLRSPEELKQRIEILE